MMNIGDSVVVINTTDPLLDGKSGTIEGKYTDEYYIITFSEPIQNTGETAKVISVYCLSILENDLGELVMNNRNKKNITPAKTPVQNRNRRINSDDDDVSSDNFGNGLIETVVGTIIDNSYTSDSGGYSGGSSDYNSYSD